MQGWWVGDLASGLNFVTAKVISDGCGMGGVIRFRRLDSMKMLI